MKDFIGKMEILGAYEEDLDNILGIYDQMAEM